MFARITTPARPLSGSRRPPVASVVLATPNRVQGEILGRSLRRLGCDVQLADCAAEARRLIHEGVTTAVLATDLGDESGWLACAKLQWAQPEIRVILLGPTTGRNRPFAEFVGARILLPDIESVARWFGAR